MSVTADLVALRAAAGGRVYEMGAVPASPGYPYVVIGYAPNAPVVRTMDAAGDLIRRFTVQHFGQNAASVEDHATRTFNTFDGKSINGDVCTLEVATTVTRDPDNTGVLSTTHTYRW